MFSRLRKIFNNLVYGQPQRTQAISRPVERQPTPVRKTTYAQVVEIDLANREIIVHEPAVSQSAPDGFSYAPSESAMLLAQATIYKENGDLDRAVDALRAAYRAALDEGIDYGIGTHLRLPLYLQKAGRTNEAWAAFETLAKNGYPGETRVRETVSLTLSTIFDKMRLFQQREKKPEAAIKFGIFSYLCLMRTTAFARRGVRIRGVDERDEIVKMLTGLLKKAKRPELLDILREFVETQVDQLPEIDLTSAGRRIDEIVF